MSDLLKYNTLIFDCDGVILNSNNIKSKAFYDVALPYGVKAAEELYTYHIKNNGISRYEKFRYFLTNIICKKIESDELKHLLNNFSKKVVSELLLCEITSNLKALRLITKNTKWFVVSGGDQNELRHVFQERQIEYLFDGGIFGSPDDKNKIIKREINPRSKYHPILFLGDSYYDYLVSKENKIDFIFVKKWTDFQDWQKFVEEENIDFVGQPSDLIK